MTTAHTPGPWEWDSKPWEYDREQEAPWLVQSGSDGLKAVLTGEIQCEEADARLIAAAPELLAACKAWVSWCADYHAGKSHPSDDLAAARAAITKATGAA